jgi:sugar lactone lactonase YvrE
MDIEYTSPDVTPLRPARQVDARNLAMPCLGGRTQVLTSTSFYPELFTDAKAIHLTGAAGDGVNDDTAAIQAAINRVVETTIRGIVFIPSGIYRVSRALVVWPGIRLIGHGATRPVLVLGDGTSGYQDEPAYLIRFAGNTPGYAGNGAGFTFQPCASRPAAIDFTLPPRDANPGTFYSALSNFDIVIGAGNPGAVAVRSTFAQHCFIAHCDLHLGSAFAGIHDGGNVCEDLRFYGGQYGITTVTPSPGWQYVLVDTSFTGQRVAAIRSRLAGLTLIRPDFSHVPTAVAMDREQGEQLSIRDGRMQDITGPALLIGNEAGSRNQLSIVGLNCRNVPVFAMYQANGRVIAAPGEVYRIADFTHGLHLMGRAERMEDFTTGTQMDMTALEAMPPPVASDIPILPPPSSWADVLCLGVIGDGVADDTEALRRAIASHRTLYFPCGAYRISGTLVLRPDTILIGLHPGATRIFIDDDCPAFRGLGDPVAMIEAPSGGCNAMIGLGIYSNAINPRAVAVKWMAGQHSFMNDVRFLGGHGTAQLNGEPERIYLHNRSADADPGRRWDTQHPSLWITDGGGGVFMDIWTPSPFAQSGLLISRTATPGRIYAMSVEHHVRCEVKLEDVANWEIHALQLEEERGESGSCLPLDIIRCRDVTFTNLFIYRVISSHQPFPYAVRTTASHAIDFRGFHCWSNSKAAFDNAIAVTAGGPCIRHCDFATYTVREQLPPVALPPMRLQRLGGSFDHLAGGAVDAAGRFYAVDARRQEIHRWTGRDPTPRLIADQPREPVNLIGDDAGNLLVVSYANGVYLLDPDRPGHPITVLQPQLGSPPAHARLGLPTNIYADSRSLSVPCPAYFASPDGSVCIPASEDFLTGRLSWGVKANDLLRAYGLQAAQPGTTVYVSVEHSGQTYAAERDAAGGLTEFRLFAEHGGEAVAVGPDGRVYIAEGHIFVYEPDGRLVDLIRTPERPLGLVFGGDDRRTLYIPAGTGLYVLSLP